MHSMSFLAYWVRGSICAAVVLSLAGCGSIWPKSYGKLFERDGVSMVTVPDNTRETYFNDPNSLERHCRAPSPDVAMTTSDGFSINAPGPGLYGGNEGITSSAGGGALSLGGRSPALLIAREMLYRACELTSNLNLPKDETIAIYERFLQSIESISKIQTSAGTSSASEQMSGSAADGETELQ